MPRLAAPEDLSAVPLTAADERVQALYDQVVRLHRSYSNQTQFPDEPYHSLLTEISLYHDHEQASYLSELSVEPKRSDPVPIGPWAQDEIARCEMLKKSYADALSDYSDLLERFQGLDFVEPADGPTAYKAPAEAVGLSGFLDASLAVAEANKIPKVLDQVEDKIQDLQKKYGSLALPCSASASCGTYSDRALEDLWKALALDHANQGKWTSETFAFVKREKDSDIQAKILVALAEGEIALAHPKDAATIFEHVAQDYPASMLLDPASGNLSDLGIFAAKQRLVMAKKAGEDSATWEKRLQEVHQAVIDELSRTRSPKMSDAYFKAGLDAVEAQMDLPPDRDVPGLPQGIFENLLQNESR